MAMPLENEIETQETQETQLSQQSEDSNSSLGKNKARGWCFTLNNPTTAEIESIKEVLADGTYVCQKEIGTKGTPHLQGVVFYSNQRMFKSMRKLYPRAHWTKCKSKKCSIVYCQKSEGRLSEPMSNSADWLSKGVLANKIAARKSKVSELRPIRDVVKDKGPNKFQAKVLEIIKREMEVTDDRAIHWVWDERGSSGKTSLAKHLYMKYPERTLYCSGKGNDVKYAVAEHIKLYKQLDIAIFGYPRHLERFVSYGALESVKDGIFFSGKYESGTVIFATPIVIVFANFPPDESALSSDRWQIYEIESEGPVQRMIGGIEYMSISVEEEHRREEESKREVQSKDCE